MTIKAGAEPNEPEISVTGVPASPDVESPAFASAAAASAPPGPPIVYASTTADQSKPMPTTTYTVPPAAAAASATPQHHPHTTTTTTYVIPAPGAAAAAAAASTTNGGAGPSGKLRSMGRDPKRLQCPFCNQQTVTRTRHEIDVFTIVIMVLLIFLFWPLFWLPLVLPGCKTTEHFCSHCQLKVGSTPACDDCCN